MKALLLSAGIGSRLRPITEFLPKCLVPINGKVLLEYWFENLLAAGVSEFIINTHYKHELVEDYINNSPYKEITTIVHEEKLLNTGGTLLRCKKILGNEAFMLVHADNLSFCDFKSFINSHLSSSCSLSMMLFKTDTPSSCGIVKLDKNGVVQEFFEKVQNPPSNLANGAVYICNHSIFKILEEIKKTEIDFSLDVLPKFMGDINTYLNDVYHRDIGTVESFALAQVEIRALKLKNK
ncbi:Mannose-1-phosphate guanylyltransferase [hydrothermal vent metagenome]|uniref:Mannose-1-phosphate guanylyltransferase n=1 Tax=hydrothermal vent metagenome TaxID=652676 RepID=A0A1W1BBV2_9ZZZZ